jgi:hypothetical protein
VRSYLYFHSALLQFNWMLQANTCKDAAISLLAIKTEAKQGKFVHEGTIGHINFEKKRC